MRNPRRKRNISILVMLIAAGAFYYAIAMGDNPDSETLQSVLGIVGLTVAFFGLCYTIYCQIETVRHGRLERGENVIARWTVDPHRWRDFAKHDATLNVPASNKISIPKDGKGLRSEGIPVVIGTKSLMVDGDFHSLPVNGFTSIRGLSWFEGPPPYLEFQLLTQNSDGPSVPSWLRIPIGAGAESDARRVYDYYTTGRPAPITIRLPGIRNHRRGRNIALVVAVISAAAFGVAISMREQEELGEILVIVAVSGVMVCLGALVIALVSHLRYRRRQS